MKSKKSEDKIGFHFQIIKLPDFQISKLLFFAFMSLRFLSKVAFVCNLFFLLALVLRYKQFVMQQDISSHIILLGWLISPFANMVFILGWCFAKKEKKSSFPLGIGIANVIFLLVQIFLFFILR